MENNFLNSRRGTVLGLIIAVVWIVCYFGARVLLRDLQLGPWLRVSVALLPIPPFALFLWSVLANIRSMDEMHRRVHLEALVIAFPWAILLLMTLGLLELAVGLNPNDWSYRHVWVFLPLFYFIGLGVSWRRYQ
jgi:hypothetical protein